MIPQSVFDLEDSDPTLDVDSLACCWEAAEQLFSHVRARGVLLFWRSFAVRGVAFKSQTDDTSGAADAAAVGPDQNIQLPQEFRVEGGWKVLDYWEGLVTSAGENYGSYITGPLLKTVKYMMDCLVKRGVRRVTFEGDLSAKLIAWEECARHKIACNFTPNLQESRRRENLLRMLSGNGFTPVSR